MNSGVYLTILLCRKTENMSGRAGCNSEYYKSLPETVYTSASEYN